MPGKRLSTVKSTPPPPITGNKVSGKRAIYVFPERDPRLSAALIRFLRLILPFLALLSLHGHRRQLCAGLGFIRHGNRFGRRAIDIETHLSIGRGFLVDGAVNPVAQAEIFSQRPTEAQLFEIRR
ncbi:hypothetical protein DP804_23280 [Salmonella enterica subsp. enterica]|nr:hypothetical protein [Salmonella enterica subsp. enterica serovar Virchow]